MGRTLQQFLTLIRNNITDPLLRQNTAKRQREVMEAFATDYFNKQSDSLQINQVAGLQNRLDQLGVVFQPFQADGSGIPDVDINNQTQFNDWVMNYLRELAGLIQVPARPTEGQVDDTGDTYSVAIVPGYAVLSDYQGFSPYTNGTVILTSATGYIQNGRVYLKGVTGPAQNGEVGIGVAASGARPAGPFLTNQQPFTGSTVIVAPPTKATAPYFGAIDDVNNTVSLGSQYSFTEVRWGVEGQGPQALGSNSVCSPGNIAGRLFAYVVADPATNRLQSDTVYSPAFSQAGAANNAPVVSLSSPQAGQSLTTGTLVVLNATPQDSDGTIAKVEFLDNGVKFAETTVAPHTIQAALTAGAHSFTARAIDDKAAVGFSNAITITGTAASSQKNLYFLFIGNSIIKGDYNDLFEYVVSGAQNYLTSINDTRTITALNLGVNGTTNSAINANFAVAYGNQLKSVDAAITDALANNFDVHVFIEENYNDFRAPYQNRTANDVFIQNQAIVTKIKAKSAAIKIAVVTPGPDRLSEYNPGETTYPTRSDFPQVAQQIATLVANDSKTGTQRYKVINRTLDNIYKAEKPTESVDGVHPNQVAVTDRYVGPRYLDAFKENEFGLPQPAPVTAPVAPANPHYLGNQMVTFPTQVGLTTAGSIITSTLVDEAEGDYGATGLAVLKMPPNVDCWVGVEFTNTDSQSSVIGVSTEYARKRYTAMNAGFGRYLDGVYAAEGGTYTQVSGATVTNGQKFRIHQSANNVLTLEQSNGSGWGPSLHTFPFLGAVDKFIVLNLAKSGKAYYAQGSGLVSVGTTDATYVLGATPISFSGTDLSYSNGRLAATNNRKFGLYGAGGLSGWKMPANQDCWVGHKVHLAEAFDSVLGLREVNFLPVPDAEGQYYGGFTYRLWNASYDPAGGDKHYFYSGMNSANQNLDIEAMPGYFARHRKAGNLMYEEVSYDGVNFFNPKPPYAIDGSKDWYIMVDSSGPGVMWFPQGVGLVAV
jgi:hypothetical protein